MLGSVRGFLDQPDGTGGYKLSAWLCLGNHVMPGIELRSGI